MLVATNWTLKKEIFNSSVQASARMEVKRRTVKNQCDSCCYTSETHNAAAAAATTPKEKESMKWVRETCPSVSEYNDLDNGGGGGAEEH